MRTTIRRLRDFLELLVLIGILLVLRLPFWLDERRIKKLKREGVRR